MDRRPRILIVEDSQLVRAWTADVLEQAGFEVATKADIWISGLLFEFDPDLVLMDVGLGVQNGATATEILKRHGAGQDRMIVLYSGKPEGELRLLAQQSGADGILCKTNDADELVARVRAFLGAGTAAAVAGA